MIIIRKFHPEDVLVRTETPMLKYKKYMDTYINIHLMTINNFLKITFVLPENLPRVREAPWYFIGFLGPPGVTLKNHPNITYLFPKNEI